MVELVCDPEGLDYHWVIRPNRSLSWRRAIRVYAVIAICCLGIGVAFALHGFWPVLPFAGFEVVVLGLAFYLSQKHAQVREVISISKDVVRVEKGRHQVEERWECPRTWARVSLQRSPIGWYPSQLTVAFQGERVEIGKFLNEEERRSLAGDLKDMLSKSDWTR